MAIVAAIQMNSTADKNRNLERASVLIEQAAASGAELVVLPELFNCLGTADQVVEQAESIEGGPTCQLLGKLSKERGLTILAGSIAVKTVDPTRIDNMSLLFAPNGELVASYQKMHLFDIDLKDRVTYCESDFMRAGDEMVVVPTAVGRLGLSICYDLRFPEFYRQLVDDNAEIVAVPAAFTETTGAPHWEVLLRARAIENQVYVIAANQIGKHSESLTTYGHSMIVDPWGKVLAQAEAETEAVVTAEISLEKLREIREQLPALKHRRLRK